MHVFNFRHEFMDIVADGTKRQTIRRDSVRKRPVEGDDIRCYYGLRTKYVQWLVDGKCTSVVDVFIGPGERGGHTIIIDGKYQSIDDRMGLAALDGFPDLHAFMQFFINSGLPFKGYLTRWEPYLDELQCPKCHTTSKPQSEKGDLLCQNCKLVL